MVDPFERGAEVDSLLARALELPSGQRRDFVREECGEDVALSEALLELLAACDAEERDPLFHQGGALAGPVFEDLVGRDDADAPTLVPGTRLGPYEVVSLLGEGGMGQVFRATDRRLDRDVALKVIDARTRSPSHVERFAREARAASALNHPNVVIVYDVGRDGALFYIAMELVEGETLRARLATGPLEPRALLDVATQLADGLAAAHARGIVHRDLKPSNVIVTSQGVAKILDFGLAQHERATADSRADTQSVRERLTGEGVIFGTVGYMSPEQASGKRVDFRSDLFSFGAILYELVTGVGAFKRGGAAATLAAILTEDPTPIASLSPELPERLGEVIARCLAKDSRGRPSTTGVLARELREIRDGGVGRAVCPDCGHGNDALNHFCAQCGADLARRGSSLSPAALSDEGERRQATLLIARPCAYEQLVERLASGDVEALMARVEALARFSIERFGGVVNRFSHEEIVGLFGVPTAREDDATQSVRAALDLRQRALDLMAAEPRLKGLSCSTRFSIHTGMLVAQASSDQGETYRVSGNAVTVAKSLCDAAAPGEIVMSSESWRLCAASVQAEAKQPVSVVGSAELTTPHRVVAAEGRTPPPLSDEELALTPLAGRGAELALLVRSLESAGEGNGQFVTLVGDAGSGKSRLLHELRCRLDRGRFAFVEARCQPYGRSVAYLPLVQACRQVLGLVEGSPAEVQERRAVDRLRELDAGLESMLPLYLHLLSVPSESHPLPKHLEGRDLRYAMQEALVALVTVSATEQPTVMIVEDGHWIDGASSEALSHLAELCGDVPLLLVVSSRPDASAGWRPETAGTSVRLEPLEGESVLSMVRGALGAEEVPPQLAVLLGERSGGNPFFLEELCRKLVSEGYLQNESGVLRLTRELAELPLPDTVQAVIRSRIDRADAAPRELLRQASVIGREFSLNLLETVARGAPALRPSLAALKGLGLIRQVGVVPAPVYRFQHALTQEVAYESLLHHQRRRLHGRVALALEAELGERVDEHADNLARHFAEAEEWDRAVEYGRRAAQRTSALGQFTQALDLHEGLRRWIGRLPPGPRRDRLTVQTLFAEESVCDILGERARQQQVTDELLALLEAGPDRGEFVDALVRQTNLLALERRFHDGQGVAARALALSRDLGDAVRERAALSSLVFVRWKAGRDQDALDTLEELLALDRKLGDKEPLASDLLNRATVLRALDRCAEALPDVREAHALLDEVDEPRRRAEANHVAALVYRGAGQMELAESYIRRNFEQYENAFHVGVFLPYGMATLATLLIERGEAEQGVEQLEKAVEACRRSRYAFGLSEIELSLAEVLIGLGRSGEALPHLKVAASTFRRMREPVGEARAASLAAPLLEADSPEEARSAWRRVLELARDDGGRPAVDALRGLARLDQKLGAVASAIGHLEEALAMIPTQPACGHRGDLLNDLGIAEWTRGEFERALARYREALEIFAALGDTTHEGLILNSIGATLRSLGRGREAAKTLDRALAVHDVSEQLALKGHALAVLGDVLLDQGEPAAALARYNESLAIRRDIGDRLGEGWMLEHIARARAAADEPVLAGESLSAALRIATECASSELADACTGSRIQ